ncbi:MAG TPA: hypothetical protein VJ773_03965, partial [Gemmatimonadales bacterium]|nr:hypothetical protein [Gemmatimonadales bacterium]
MDPLLIALRLIHVVAGILWVGFAVFVPFYLAPALAEAGPESARVMGALQRRGLTTVMPVLAVLTILAGLWLYWRASGGSLAGYLGTTPGLVLGLGGVAAILGFAIGMLFARPAMMRAAALAQSIPPGAPPEERARIAAAA